MRGERSLSRAHPLRSRLPASDHFDRVHGSQVVRRRKIQIVFPGQYHFLRSDDARVAGVVGVDRARTAGATRREVVGAEKFELQRREGGESRVVRSRERHRRTPPPRVLVESRLETRSTRRRFSGPAVAAKTGSRSRGGAVAVSRRGVASMEVDDLASVTSTPLRPRLLAPIVNSTIVPTASASEPSGARNARFETSATRREVVGAEKFELQRREGGESRVVRSRERHRRTPPPRVLVESRLETRSTRRRFSGPAVAAKTGSRSRGGAVAVSRRGVASMEVDDLASVTSTPLRPRLLAPIVNSTIVPTASASEPSGARNARFETKMEVVPSVDLLKMEVVLSVDNDEVPRPVTLSHVVKRPVQRALFWNAPGGFDPPFPPLPPPFPLFRPPEPPAPTSLSLCPACARDLFASRIGTLKSTNSGHHARSPRRDATTTPNSTSRTRRASGQPKSRKALRECDARVQVVHCAAKKLRQPGGLRNEKSEFRFIDRIFASFSKGRHR